jgi:uncharacterized membrane protein
MVEVVHLLSYKHRTPKGISIMNWNNSAIIPAIIGLFLFGVIYAIIVYFMNGKHEGYTALLVVVGVAVTVAASGPVIGWDVVIYLALAFAASGVPMIVGDVIRGIKRREAAERQLQANLNQLAERGIEGVKYEGPPVRK